LGESGSLLRRGGEGDAACAGRSRPHAAGCKRGGELRIEQLDEGADVGVARSAELIALDDALTSLAEEYPRQAEVVELRYFGGLSIEKQQRHSRYRLKP